MADEFQFRLFSQRRHPLELQKVLPPSLQKFHLNDANVYYAGLKKQGHIIFQTLYDNAFKVYMGNYLINSPTSFHIQSFGDSILLYLFLEGGLNYRSKAQYSRALANHMNLIPARSVDHLLEFSGPGENSLFLLFIPVDYLRHFRLTFPTIWEIKESLVNPIPETLAPKDIMDDGRLRDPVEKLIQSHSAPGVNRWQFLHLIEEIIVAGFDLYSQSLMTTDGQDPGEMKAVFNTKSKLLSGIRELRPPPLSQLAKDVIMTEKKLEDLFKTIVGTTMFDFFQSARMEAIYRRIIQPDIFLQQIADDFNYLDYSSFSAAVKKKFNLSPREIRKRT